MRRTITLILLFAASLIAHAQTGALSGYCNLGGAHAKTSGLSASNFQQGIIPHCSITVYLTGTTTLATIYSDGASTPLANPFTANASTSTNSGAWTFWAATNAGLDVIGSGGDAPNTYPAPVPLCVDCFVTDSLTPQAGVISINTVQGNFTFTGPDVNCTGTSCNFSNTTGATLQHNGTDLPTQNLLNFLDTPPALPTNYVPVTFANDGAGGLGGYVPPANVAGGLEMSTTPPIPGQYVFVPASASSSSGVLSIPAGGPFEVDDQIDWAPPVLPSYINPANVTAIYATATYTEVNYRVWNDLMNAPGQAAIVLLTCAGVNLVTVGTGLTTLTGATFGTASCTAKLSANYSGAASMNVSRIGYFVYYTGDPPPADTTVKVKPCLYYNASVPELGVTWPCDGAVDTGSVNALAVTILAGDPSTWSEIKVSPAFANTSTTPRLSVNGATSVTIKGPTGGALVAGDISTSVVARFIKNLDGYYLLENPQVSGSGGGTTTNALTAAATGGAAPGTTFDGSTARTFDYHSFGAPGISGTPTTGNCVDWASANTLGDTGAPCGSGGGSSVGTAGQLQMVGATAGSFAASAVTDDGTTVTVSEPLAVDDATGAGGGLDGTEGTAQTPAAGHDIIYADSASHCFMYSANGAAFSCLAAGAGITSINSQTGPAINVHSSDGSVNVNTTPNDIDLTTAGGGGSSDPTVIDITAAPYYASPYGATTTTGTFSASATSGTVGSCSTFVAGNGVYIAGGASGGWTGTAYIGTVVSCTGTTLTFTPAITNSVTGAVVQHDETAAFLAAFTALTTSPGGKINLPSAALGVQGVYLVNGPLLQTSGANAILPMPQIPNYSTTITDIEIAGFRDQTYTGPIIQTALNVSGANLFGGYDSAAGGGVPNFTNVSLVLSNVMVVGPLNGSETLVNGTWILNLETHNVFIGYPGTITTIPTNGIGIIFPSVNNDVHEDSPENLEVRGVGTQVKLGEHASINKLILSWGVTGVVLDAGNVAYNRAITINHMWCGSALGLPSPNPSQITNCIAAGSNATAFTIRLADYEGAGTLVNDPSNLLHGTISYNLSASCPTNATISGAANIAFTNLKCIAGGKQTVTTGAPTAGHLAVFNSDGYSVSDGGAPSGAVWGAITGTLSSQTDLQSALNALAPLASPTFTGTPDASGATAIKLPVSAGCVATTQGNICYDSTNKNWHLWVNGVDKMLIPLAAGFTSGHCGQPTLSGTSWEIQDAGGACGVSGGGAAFSAITTGTNTTATMTVGTGGSIVRSGTGIVDANQLNSVPFCTGFTPTNGQNLQYTTASSPNPCYTAATPAAAATGVWTVANVTGSRVVNTIYHNTSGSPIVVVIAVATVASNASEIKILSDSSSTPTTQIVGVSATGSTFSIVVPLEFVVMAGDYYQMPTSAALSSILAWTEYTITKGSMTVSADLSGSRVYGTPYQNTSGSVMLVELEVSGASTMTSSFNTDSSATPTTIAVQKSLSDSGTKLSFLVPVLPGNYYEMVNTAGTGTVTHWHEITWTSVSATQSAELTSRAVNTSNFNYLNTTGKYLWTAASYSVPALGTMNAYYLPNTGQGEGTSVALTASVAPSFNITGYSGDSNVTRSVSFGVNPGGTYDINLDGNTGTAKSWIEWLFY
jgi:hypothetical protein